VIVGAARSEDAEGEGPLLINRDRARFTARIDPRARARAGDRIQLAVDISRLYLFEPESGRALAKPRGKRTAEPATS